MENDRTNYLPESEVALEPLTLEAIYDEKIFEVTYLRDVHWMKDGKRFSVVETFPDTKVNSLWMYEVEKEGKTPVIPMDALRLPTENTLASGQPENSKGETEERQYIAITGYQWSPDETQILIARLPKRRASEGDKALYVYTLATEELACITPITTPETEYRNAKWSPDGKYIGYVRDNDIYLYSVAEGVEIRLTNTGSGALYNGRFGWVYEEELDLTDGWSWSPDGRYIVFFEQDEARVPVVPILNYDDLHCKPLRTHYPKAGDPNPQVRIGVLDTASVGTEDRNTAAEEPVWVDLGEDADIYLTRVQWTPQGELLLQRVPRLQNRLEFLKADPRTGISEVILVEEDSAWVDRQGDVTFVGESDEFLLLSDRDGHSHLYLVDLSGRLIRQVTQGDWDVTAIHQVDISSRTVAFSAAYPTPMERQTFRARLDSEDIVRLSPEPGTHHPLFAPQGGWYLDAYSRRERPPRTSLYDAEGNRIRVLCDNLMPKLNNRRLSVWEFITCETSDGMLLNLAMLKPADFDPARKYPVVMFTYGGPGSQVVLDQFGGGYAFEQWLAQCGYLCVMVDGRGSGGRGREFKKIVYQNLGHWEVNDQIEAARWLQCQSYVDAERIGIWGWSYGGYVTSLCIMRGAEVFKAACAVAPVTHWELYDSIYTERYMRRPTDNPQGYEVSAPLNHVDSLKGPFLLMHGTSDDNVHFQNAARLAAELQKRNKRFQTMFYPGKHHGIEGVSLHVFTMISDFFRQNL